MRELPDFSRARVLVAGDLMLDRYWQGVTERISPEAPVPVVHVRAEEGRPGGSGNVALNVAALGGQVELLGLIGDDEAGQRLQTLLSEAGVRCHLLRDARYPTVTKLRILSRHQQLIRLDFEDGFPGFDGSALTAALRPLLDGAGVLVLSDYAKGTLSDPQPLIRAARERGVPVLVDPKGRDFTRYRGATLITPNLAEFEAVVGHCPFEQDLERRGLQLLQELEFDQLLITRGEHGMTLLSRDADPFHLPTQAREVFDVTGAGDTVVATLAVALGAGVEPHWAVQLANLAAGVVVGKLGTASVTPAELERRWWEQRPDRHGVMTEAELLESVRAARGRGERLVMTNGCFDILHAGHVTYLEQAARLGDRLIVAVNVDEEVRQLKGQGRPVNPLANRMRVLAALECVDWVVPFSEPTPERLICALKPDILVKGGDNDPDRIPGGACVRAAGGEVLVLDYVEGVSTTAIVRSIRGD